MTTKDPRETPAEPEGHDLPADPQPVPDEWDTATSATAAEASLAVAQAEERLLRLAAEYDNYRKRTNREKTESFDRGSGAMVARLLEVLDDMERLATSDPKSTSYADYRHAFDLVQKKLAKELEAAGLERVDPTGAAFDPNLHDAVAVLAPPSEDLDHTVKSTFQTGYRFKGTVLRPARVQVYSVTGAA